MAPKRLPRGSRKDPATLFYEVERAHKEKWGEIAAHAGMSPSALFDLMVDNLELDDRGFPTWLPAQPLRDGELPIDSA